MKKILFLTAFCLAFGLVPTAGAAECAYGKDDFGFCNPPTPAFMDNITNCDPTKTSCVPSSTATETPLREPTTVDVNFISLGGPTSAEDLVGKILKFLNFTIAAVAALGIIIGGVVLMSAAGDDSQVQKGKDIILYSVIGLVITILAYVIVNFTQTALYSVGE